MNQPSLDPQPIAAVDTEAPKPERDVKSFPGTAEIKLPPKTKRVMAHYYHNPAGDNVMLVLRLRDTVTGEKTYRPYVSHDGATLVSGGHPNPRPLYRLPQLMNAPGANVLVVEGEKACEAAEGMLPPGFVATTWSGGASSVKNTDWTPLAGRNVVIWPDNDAPGSKAAAELSDILTDLRCPHVIVSIPDSWPEHWDLADDPPNGMTKDRLTQAIANRLDECHLSEPPPERLPARLNGHASVKPASDAEMGIDENRPPFKALGHDGRCETYTFFTQTSNGLVDLGRKEIFTETGLLTLLPDPVAWMPLNYGQRPEVARDWKGIGMNLVRECQELGPWSESGVIRKAGIWADAGRVVGHFGREVYVNGASVSPNMINSKYVYPFSGTLVSIKDVPALNRDEAAALRAICHKLRWDNPFHADVLAGLIATAPISGALGWRTHGWLTGERGCGKSWVINTLFKACFGNFCVNLMGTSTEAGIRGQVDGSALPVLFDEAERKDGGEFRIDKVVELMRAASSATTAGVAKGSADHTGRLFKINSTFICAAIGVGNLGPADLSRIIVLTLKGGQANDETERATIKNHFDELTVLMDALPADLPAKLLRRMMEMTPTVIKNAKLMRELIATHFADARTGDQVGVVLAGAFALMSDEVLGREEAMNRLASIDWTLYQQAPETREDVSLCNWLASQIVDVEGPQDQRMQRSIGELIAAACNVSADGERIMAHTAKAYLQRYGIRYRCNVGDEQGVMVAKDHSWLNKRFRDSNYPGTYFDIIARHREAKKREPGDRRQRFAGAECDWVWLPYQVFTGDNAGID